MAAAAALVGLWVAGLALRDRYLWSQFVFWIPPAALGAALLVVVSLLMLVGSRRAALGFGALLLLLAGQVFLIDHRPLRSAPAATSDSPRPLRLLHCNLHWPSQKASPAVLDFALGRPEDLLVFSEPGWLLSKERGKQLQESGWQIARIGRYAVLSRLPLVEYRSLVAQSRVDVTLLRIDAGERGLGVLTMALVDLPSTPTVARMEMAVELRSMLDEIGAPEFDLVVGDTNLTRGSAALATIFPGHRNAWDDAGRGCGASYPAGLPLWHIDQTLLGPALRAIDYRLVDIGLSAHRAQVVEVVAESAAR